MLDVGCGGGRFLPDGAVGLDADIERLRAARARTPFVIQADARWLPLAAASFDTAYAHRMLNDSGDIDRVLEEIARVLRPRGRLLVFTRARPGAGERLDRTNAVERLRARFRSVTAELHPTDDRAALFVAEGPRA